MIFVLLTGQGMQGCALHKEERSERVSVSKNSLSFRGSEATVGIRTL